MSSSKQREQRRMLRASAVDQRRLQLSGDGASVEWLTAADDADKPKTFSMVAYTGAKIRQWWSSYDIVVDLASMKQPSKSRPILRDHDPSKIVGHTTEITITARTILVKGIVSGENEHAREVTASSAKGFPWQASIGAGMRLQFVDKGEKVTVNGRGYSGPLYVARDAVLGEVSFVPLGADDNTSAHVAASHQRSKSMDKFDEWVAAKGFAPADLNDSQRDTLQAAYDAEVKAAEAAKKKPTEPKGNDGSSLMDDMETHLQRQAAEAERVDAIHHACEAAGNPTIKIDGRDVSLKAHAIRNKWDSTKVELELLRASRPSHQSEPQVYAPHSVLRAALMQACGVPEDVALKAVGEKSMQAAHTQFRGRIGLQQTLLEMAWQGGHTGRHFETSQVGLRNLLQAAFSTQEANDIFADVANKRLLAGWNTVEDTWRQISSITPVSDFKAINSYRLNGDFEYDEVGPDGELKHGTISDETYTNQAKTYGKMFAITRTHLINDDLGALNALPFRIGRGGALKLNKVFWTEFMDNTSFFTSGRGNYMEGATTNLSITSLTAIELLFLNQTDPDGNPTAIMPELLLVPNALNVLATQLMRDTEVRDTTASTKFTTGNPHAGKFRVVRSSYLSNAAFTGYSTTAFYLLANPNSMPVVETVFLNGNESPIVETADADFNTLGIQMRGYHDFGVNMQEYRGGCKSKGAA